MIESMIVGKEGPQLQAAAHSIMGLRALVAEMADQGVPVVTLLKGTGVEPQQLLHPQAGITLTQKIMIFRNALGLSTRPDVGLRAGARQRLCDFGVYGYALISSSHIHEAVELGVKHVKLAGPVLEKRFRVVGDTAIFEARDVLSLGPVLPVASEFWFASVLRLAECVLEGPFPSRRLLLPYARPAYAQAYEAMFNCPVEFNAGVMEWHFDASILALPCPNANPITGDICVQFCNRMLASLNDDDELPRTLREAFLNSRGASPTADMMAARMGVSVRTLHRRLADLGQSYQQIADDVRCALAKEFLASTSMTVETIAGRVGFSEASNFRKAFRKWTGMTPAEFRAGVS